KDLQAIAADLGTDDALGRVRSMGAAGAAIAFLAAAFIVATAMAAGVGERARQLALLRCVGMTRAQVAGAVLAEAAVLGLAGGIGGLLLGRLWLGLLGLFDPVFHPTSALGDPLADLLALLAAIGVGLLAALAPARAATRVRPLDVIGGAASPARAPVLRGILGALLVTGAWAVAFLLPLPPLADLVALPLLAIGCWALAPALVLLCGRVLATPVARVCGVLPALLRQQLGQRLRLAGGTALTLAVCLGLAMTLQIWGRSMVTPFLPSPQLPQLIIGLFPAGLPPEAVGELTGVTGIDHERALALQADQFLLAPALHGRVDAGEATVMVLGLDPAAALTGPDPLLSLDYAAGLDAAAAAAALADGGALVPPDLSQRLGIGIGEELPLLTRDGVVSVTIRGHAALQGWHWVTKLGRMRSLPGRPLAPIIVPPETAARLGIDRVRHLWADAAPGADRQQIRAQLQPIVARHAGAYQQPNYGPAVSGDAVVKLVDTRDVARRMQERSDAVIWVLGAIPLAALLVAGLGVAQAMAAGIRSRSWEFGIMRSVGLDGAACGRLVLAEAVLLALAAALLAALFGIAAAQLAIAPSLQAFQAGAAASLIVPWIELLADLCIGVAAALLAAWIPARRLARREPLQLLQGGRAAA
ncbi:MAG: FtsX-like permease family protein, partial [Planctomycetota bacterium]